MGEQDEEDDILEKQAEWKGAGKREQNGGAEGRGQKGAGRRSGQTDSSRTKRTEGRSLMKRRRKEKDHEVIFAGIIPVQYDII